MGEEKYNDGFDHNDPEELGLDDLINFDYETPITRTISEKEKQEYKETDDRIQVLTIWKDEKKTEQRMKQGLSLGISIILVIQVIFINVIVWKIGKGEMDFDEWTIRLFITGIFAEIVALVKIVINNLFPKSGNKDFMDFINTFYFNKRNNNSTEENKNVIHEDKGD